MARIWDAGEAVAAPLVHRARQVPAHATQWHDADAFWNGLELGPPRATGTRVVLDGYAGERLRMATFRHAPHVLSFEGIAPAHRGAALLSLQLEGNATVEQYGRRSRIAQDDFCLVDLSRPFRLEFGASTVQTIYLPITALREAVPQVAMASAIGLPGDRGPVGYLRVLFREIFYRASDLTEAVASRLLDAIPHMLAAALETTDPTRLSATQLRLHYKQQARRFAREHLDDPELCAEMIARGIGLSVSYLFELFSDEDLTLMRWVRGERLARCKRELADPALRHRGVSQIAYGWGFGDMTHFSRSFRDVYGASPRSFRQAALAHSRNIARITASHTGEE
ncbi:helix-turn-helix domain-containing protein [Pinirhizobacter soli]|uniref:helix-turn-helix domain-containing protein n=1 Tax=Pinirhizobacter soli TaxID=2786953 RepID=UPI00202A12BD|nr:helix-turn-helix domain-containing protein [Pinirhizobacter soli]